MRGYGVAEALSLLAQRAASEDGKGGLIVLLLAERAR